jgi:hypothetical protein
MHPSVERRCPFFAAGARLNPHGVSHFLDYVAQTYFLLNEETRKTHAMRLLLGFLSLIRSCFFLLHDLFVPISASSSSFSRSGKGGAKAQIIDARARIDLTCIRPEAPHHQIR